MNEQGIAVYTTEVSEIERQALALEVKSDEDLSKLSDWTKQVKDVSKKVTIEKDEYVKPAKEIISKAKSVYDPFLELAKKVEKILKDKGTAYVIARNKAIEDQKGKIAGRAERGTIREETAVRKMEELPDQIKTAKGESSEFRVTMVDDVEIVDEALIPREYLDINMPRLRAAVCKARIEVPGAKLIQKPRTSSY